MKFLWSALLLVGLTSCSTSRVSLYDEFEKVKVDRMTGNAVSANLFSRTLVCLNAARESRGLVAQTNVTVAFITNSVVSSVTNLTVSTSGNSQVAVQTNAVAAAVAVDTNAPAATSNPANAGVSGITTATAQNESIASSPNQQVRSGSIQVVTTLNSQATINKDSFALTIGTNEVSTVETNYVITTVTNQVVTPVTNVVVKTSENPVADYYLSTEIAPADFALVAGESLIVLADGVRFGCTQATPQAAWESRRGFLTTYYKVSADVIVAIANAREVKLRIKGTAGTLERTMNDGSRNHFREFLIQHFSPATEARQKSVLKG